MDRSVYLQAPSTTPGVTALLLEWNVDEGEALRAGQPIAQILDRSGTITVVSPCHGRLVEHWVDVGAPVVAGQRLARLEGQRSENDPPPDGRG